MFSNISVVAQKDLWQSNMKQAALSIAKVNKKSK